MTHDQFREWVLSRGWTEDRYGNFRKGEYRYKMQRYSVRLESSYKTTATEYMKSETKWIRLRSGYLSQLSISVDGLLQGMHK